MRPAREVTETDAPRGPRLRLRVRGAVQGVGFRPFAHRLAARYGLSGFVRNDAEGVLVEIEGARASDFVAALTRETPPLARIDKLESETLAARGGSGFVIEASRGGRSATHIPPDAAVCEACLDDLFDPSSRFHLYPFVTCTHCGPRYTLTRRIPYDRHNTSMAGFALCPDCARDYGDPESRRFHAEPIGCPACGPKLSHAPAEIAAALRAGRIVAVKGIGGFHLMCDAGNEEAVAELRRRKARDAKPFAVMAANLTSVEAFAAPTPAERALLQSVASPVVLIDRRMAHDRRHVVADERPLARLAASIAPNLTRVGVLLPHAPLHHLIFFEAAGAPAGYDRRAANDLVIVATSANRGGEPVAAGDEDARLRLGAIADLIVTHDRPIVVRADDSVAQIIDGAPAFIRRARGFAPEPIALPDDGPCVLALGAHLKTTVTVTRGREAFVSQHVGALDNAETIRFYEETIRHLLAILDAAPEAIVCDLHPDAFSSRYAEDSGLPVVRVQHHAAHIGAIAAEHGLSGPVLGLALDGHGHGPQGEAWGGEALLIDGARFDRYGSLTPLALPGGDRAAREPWRMALAALHRLDRLDDAARRFGHIRGAAQLASHMRLREWPTTSSLGRLFDAAAGLLGLCERQAFEGEAPMRLEALVATPRALAGGYRLDAGELDFLPLLAALAEPGVTPSEGAELFHGTLIAGLTDWAEAAANASGSRRIALGGGCFANRVLAQRLAGALRARGFEPLLARRLPAGDGGLSLGQARAARIELTRPEQGEQRACASPFQPA